MKKFKEDALRLLGPVYYLHFNEDLQKAVKAVSSGDKNEIKKSIKKLEDLLKNTKRKDFSSDFQYTAWKHEISAKVLILKATLTGKGKDLRDAGKAYKALANVLFNMGGFLEKNASTHAVALSQLCNI